MPIVFDEMHRKEPKHRQIQLVQPDHGPGPVLAVVVPVPAWRQDHVAPLHGDAPAVHGRETSAAFDDEAHGEGGVSVRRGYFVGHHEL